MKKIFLTLLFCISLPSYGNEGTGSYSLIGELVVACPVVFSKNKDSSIPERLKITPEKAASLAVKAGALKCNSVFLHKVFVQNGNYVIIKDLEMPITDESSVIVINGSTGAVHVRDGI